MRIDGFLYIQKRKCGLITKSQDHGKDGAYHLAAKYNVPIIPTFIAMYEREGEFDKDGFNKLDYKLYVMPLIYPDMSKPMVERKKELKEKDYKLKVQKYEEAYGKKLDYKFEYSDIAGYVEDKVEENAI